MSSLRSASRDIPPLHFVPRDIDRLVRGMMELDPHEVKIQEVRFGIAKNPTVEGSCSYDPCIEIIRIDDTRDHVPRSDGMESFTSSFEIPNTVAERTPLRQAVGRAQPDHHLIQLTRLEGDEVEVRVIQKECCRMRVTVPGANDAAQAAGEAERGADYAGGAGTRGVDETPACDICSRPTVRNGTTYKCSHCGNTINVS